jgi:hypothetical protein
MKHLNNYMYMDPKPLAESEFPDGSATFCGDDFGQGAGYAWSF